MDNQTIIWVTNNATTIWVTNNLTIFWITLNRIIIGLTENKIVIHVNRGTESLSTWCVKELSKIFEPSSIYIIYLIVFIFYYS